MDALIVDDDASVRALLDRVLRGEGWRAHLCGRADDAVTACSEASFSLAFVDVQLGDGPDGFFVAKRLRALRPGISVILMSGSVGQETRAAREGLDPILLKPFAIDHVRGLLRAWRPRPKKRGTRAP